MDEYGFKLNELKDDKKLKNYNYETWERLITPYLFAVGAYEIIFGVDGPPPLPKPHVTAAVGTPLHKHQKEHLDRWNRGNQAGIQTISLNLDVGQKHIILQHQGKNVIELWYAIRALHKRNTRGQRGLAKNEWLSSKGGS